MFARASSRTWSPVHTTSSAEAYNTYLEWLNQPETQEVTRFQRFRDSWRTNCRKLKVKVGIRTRSCSVPGSNVSNYATSSRALTRTMSVNTNGKAYEVDVRHADRITPPHTPSSMPTHEHINLALSRPATARSVQHSFVIGRGGLPVIVPLRDPVELVRDSCVIPDIPCRLPTRSERADLVYPNLKTKASQSENFDRECARALDALRLGKSTIRPGAPVWWGPGARNRRDVEGVRNGPTN